MHKCVRCERVAASIEEIDQGCPCGSKVFVYIRDSPLDSVNGVEKKEAAAQPGEKTEAPPPEAATPGPEGKAPQSYFARTTFTHDDVENIKVMSEGVFLLDVNAISRNPLVLKDEEGIYYVKIPFEQNGKKK